MIVKGAFIRVKTWKEEGLGQRKNHSSWEDQTRRDETHLSRARDDSMSFFTPKTGSSAESVPKHIVDPKLQPWVEK